MFFTADQVGNFARIVYNKFVCQTISQLQFSLYCVVVLVHNSLDNVKGRPRRFLYSRGDVKDPLVKWATAFSVHEVRTLSNAVNVLVFPSICVSSDSVKT